jgi:hypothetical protein
MMNADYWYLIENNSHQLLKFSSLYRLKKWAEQHGWKIRKSPTDENTYYTTSYQHVPGK